MKTKAKPPKLGKRRGKSRPGQMGLDWWEAEDEEKPTGSYLVRVACPPDNPNTSWQVWLWDEPCSKWYGSNAEKYGKRCAREAYGPLPQNP